MDEAANNDSIDQLVVLSKVIASTEKRGSYSPNIPVNRRGEASPSLSPKGTDKHNDEKEQSPRSTAISPRNGSITKRMAGTTPSSGFAGLSPRFPDPKPETPSSTYYDVSTSSFKSANRLSASFKSDTPRLHHKDTNCAPPCTIYSVQPMLKKTIPACSSFKATSKRFVDPKTHAPPPTSYTQPSSFNIPKRKMNFLSSSQRFRDPKPETPPATAYNPNVTAFPQNNKYKSAAFASTLSRFSEPGNKSRGRKDNK